MPGPSRIGGIASAFIDGVAVTAKGSLSYKPNATKREAQIQMDGTWVGYTENGDPPWMQFDMFDTGVTRVADYYTIGNRQIIVQLANGKQVTGSQMTMMEPPEVKNDDGTYTMKWTGVSVVETPRAG